MPYVDQGGSPALGTLVSELSHNGATTIAPGSHEMWFVGSLPCDNLGRVLDQLINQRVSRLRRRRCRQLLVLPEAALRRLSRLLRQGHHLCSPPHRLREGDRLIDDGQDLSGTRNDGRGDGLPLRRAASSRAGIGAISAKLKLGKVAIVGLGGTGAYILDLVAKTPVEELHLYDDDVLYAHNAFRVPGAASLAELEAMPKKVNYLFSRYDPIRRKVFAHPVRLDNGNLDDLATMDFVFLAIDAGSAKQAIIEKLRNLQSPVHRLRHGALPDKTTLWLESSGLPPVVRGTRARRHPSVVRR